jgi:hypothetical protein
MEYTTATTFHVDVPRTRAILRLDDEAAKALAQPYVWDNVDDARDAIHTMTEVNGYDYSQYETPEATIVAIRDFDGNVDAVIHLERAVSKN